MPTPADTLVAAYRNWLDTQGGGGPFGSLADPSSRAAKAAAAAAAAAGSATLSPAGTLDSRRQLLDRYHQHTVHCASCRWAWGRLLDGWRAVVGWSRGGVVAGLRWRTLMRTCTRLCLCRKALQTVTLLRQVAAVAATVAAAACLLPFLALLNPAAPAAAATAGASLRAAAGAAWLPGVLAAVLGAAWLLLGKLRNQFLWVDYNHNEK